MHKVNIAEKFARISEYWKPYIAAELNGQLVKFDKLKGEFVFHHHEHEDEMFLVVKGRFRMEFRDRHEWIEEGRVHRRSAGSGASPRSRRRMLDSAIRTGLHAKHRQRCERTHAAPA